MKISTIIRTVICVSIFYILLSWIGLEKIIQTFSKINPIYLIPAIIIFLIGLLIGAYNLKILIDKIKPIKFIKILKYYLIAWSAGTFSPGRVGEFSLLFLLKKEGITLGEGLAITIIDKITTVFSLMVGTLLLTYILLSKEILSNFTILFLIIILLGLITLVFNKYIRNFIKKHILRKYSKSFTGFYKTLVQFFKEQKLMISLNLFLTILKWYLGGITAYLTFLCFGINTDLNLLFLVIVATNLIALIPVSISGLGVKEGVCAYLLSLQGIAPEITISVFLIWNIINYGLGLIIFSYSKEITKELSNIKNKLTNSN